MEKNNTTIWPMISNWMIGNTHFQSMVVDLNVLFFSASGWDFLDRRLLFASASYEHYYRREDQPGE